MIENLAILKLFVTYANLPNRSAHGTAWLIRPDLAVTAGHNLYDWKYKAGAAVKIKAYAGYHGRASVDDPNYKVEFREGSRCIAPDRWLTTRGAKPFDVGFIKFDKPFTEVTPFQYVDTPKAATERIGVVGYPADRVFAETGERGASMYRMYLETKWDLEQQADTMLEYLIDTEGGQFPFFSLLLHSLLFLLCYLGLWF